MLNEPSFTQNAKRLRAISRIKNGCETAVKTIERGFLHYSVAQVQTRDGVELFEPSHLIDNDHYE